MKNLPWLLKDFHFSQTDTHKIIFVFPYLRPCLKKNDYALKIRQWRGLLAL